MKSRANPYVLNNLIFTATGGFFIFAALVIPAEMGLTILSQILVWIGCLILFSARFADPGNNQLYAYCKLGLAVNVCGTFGVELFGRLLYSGEWWLAPFQVKLLSLLRWTFFPLPTLYKHVSIDLGWQSILASDFLALLSVLAFYFNVLLYIVLTVVVLSTINTLRHRHHSPKTTATDALTLPKQPPVTHSATDETPPSRFSSNAGLKVWTGIGSFFTLFTRRSGQKDIRSDLPLNNSSTTAEAEATENTGVEDVIIQSLPKVDQDSESPAPLQRAIPRPFHAWLEKELGHLEEFGLIDHHLSTRLKDYYAPDGGTGKFSLPILIAAVLGATLIALGIILILAHNWQDLSRTERAVISFLPLLAGQALATKALLKHHDSLPWREGSATFLTLTIGATIALVGQTYHISGDLPRFLLVWSLLGLPLAYLFRAALPAALVWVGFAAWCAATRLTHASPTIFPWLMLLPAPVLIIIWQNSTRSMARIWLCWAMALTSLAGVGFYLGSFNSYLFIYIALLLSCFYLIDHLFTASSEPVRRRPLLMIGAGLLTILIFAQTFNYPILSGFWRTVPWQAIFKANLLSALILTNVLLLGFSFYRRRSLALLTFGSSGLLLLVHKTIGGSIPPHLNIVIFNLYLFFIGVVTLLTGFRHGRLSSVNGAMLVFTMMIIARFFDTNIPFTVKGGAFLLVGTAFLGTNLILRRKAATA